MGRSLNPVLLKTLAAHGILCNRTTPLRGSLKLWRFDVAKAEWGQKRICPSCNSRYYDMKKNPPVCPSCGTVFDPEILLRARRGRSADKKAAAAPVPEEIIEEIPAADGEEGDDAVIEDAEELGEDGAVEDVVVEPEV